jgi:anti-sigma regulatory factor (Ser/Thr protein kinase)
MTSDGTALRHNAFVYESQDEYLACAVPFLQDGLRAGEGAIVAHTRPGLAIMREALGSAASDVTFVDVGSVYTRPARTLATYHAVYARQLQRAPRLRAIADVQLGPDPREWDLWVGYEAVLNRSFGHLPAWVLCSYDANGTPDPIIEGVWRTHPEVLDATTWTASSVYDDPDGLLRRLTPPPAPLPQLRALATVENAEQLRERLAPELVAAGRGDARTLEMLLAVSEIAANAVQHGGGIEDVRVGQVQGRFVCEVIDRGPGFDDPAAGYLVPRAGGGRGLWVARQLSRRLELFASPRGFTARVWL